MHYVHLSEASLVAHPYPICMHGVQGKRRLQPPVQPAHAPWPYHHPKKHQKNPVITPNPSVDRQHLSEGLYQA